MRFAGSLLQPLTVARYNNAADGAHPLHDARHPQSGPGACVHGGGWHRRRQSCVSPRRPEAQCRGVLWLTRRCSPQEGRRQRDGRREPLGGVRRQEPAGGRPSPGAAAHVFSSSRLSLEPLLQPLRAQAALWAGDGAGAGARGRPRDGGVDDDLPVPRRGLRPDAAGGPDAGGQARDAHVDQPHRGEQ